MGSRGRCVDFTQGASIGVLLAMCGFHAFASDYVTHTLHGEGWVFARGPTRAYYEFLWAGRNTVCSMLDHGQNDPLGMDATLDRVEIDHAGRWCAWITTTTADEWGTLLLDPTIAATGNTTYSAGLRGSIAHMRAPANAQRWKMCSDTPVVCTNGMGFSDAVDVSFRVTTNLCPRRLPAIVSMHATVDAGNCTDANAYFANSHQEL